MMSNQLDIPRLKQFLLDANGRTYADVNAKPAPSSLPDSKDYTHIDGDLMYHDIYFGSPRFSGLEVIYLGGKAVWSMNYYGRILDDTIEAGPFYDNILRPALLQGNDEELPVRGPREVVIDGHTYTFESHGDFSEFEGVERIARDGVEVYRLGVQGGFVK